MNNSMKVSQITQEEFVLAAMSPALGSRHSPVQIQKLLFVLDTELSEKIGGPHFDFQPYDYGPFDKRVYEVLEALQSQSHMVIRNSGSNYPLYSLSPSGLEKGTKVIARLDERAQTYIERLSQWVMKRTFSELVAAIYKAYPDMRVNSVFCRAK